MKQEEWRGGGNCGRCIGWGKCRTECLAHKERMADQQSARVKKALLIQIAQKEAISRG